MHPFTDGKALAAKAARESSLAPEGVYVYDSDGNKILDGMAGLWCVAVGYGRRVAQSTQLPDRCASAAVLQQLFPDRRRRRRSSWHSSCSGTDAARLEPFLLSQLRLGSERHRHTPGRVTTGRWQASPDKRTFIGRTYGYHGSTLAASSMGGMAHHARAGQEVAAGVRAHLASALVHARRRFESRRSSV